MTTNKAETEQSKRQISKFCAQAARAHVRAFRDSGMSLPDYCHQHGIAKSTFYGWLERYERKAPKNFTPVLPRPASLPAATQATMPIKSDPTPEQAMDITLPNGITIQILNLKHSTQVIQFIKGLM